MANDAWTANQIKLALGSILQRLHTNHQSFKIEIKSNSTTISSYVNNKSIYLTLDKNLENRIYLAVDGHSGSYYPTKKGYFWQKDKDYDDIMELITKLQGVTVDGRTTDDVLVSAFPEILDVEFEDKVLKGDNNGKESK